MGERVERIATPANEGAVVPAIVSAWSNIFGQKPTLRQIAKTWAQIAIETYNGNSIFNNNVGNITFTPNFSGNYYETKDSRTIGNDPANRQFYTAKMRAYDSLSEGVQDYLNLLKNRPEVAKALENGSPADFSAALASVHYYDPHVKDDYINKQGKKVSGYTTGLTSIYNSFMTKHRSGLHVQKPRKENSFLTSFLNNLGSLLDNLMKSASNKNIGKYGSKYPKNIYTLKIINNDFTSKVEFANVLKLALKEELDSDSTIHIEDESIEIQCSIYATEEQGLKVLKELSTTISDIFQEATKKIGGIQNNVLVSTGTSGYQILDIKISETNHRKFCYKFIGYNETR